MKRWWPAVVWIALLGATLAPLLRSPYADSFPLSTYPMFAMARPTTVTLTYALTEPRGSVSPDYVGSREPLQAMAILERAAERPDTLRELCEKIASRVAGDHDGAKLVRIVTGTHDAVAYLIGGVIGREVERVRCPVP